MLNYINSELFRISRNKKLYILIGVVAALIIMMGVVLAGFGKDPDFPYATTAFSLGNEYRSMNYLLLILLILAMYLDDNEHKQHTMKHSVAYGIGRHTIYIARFVAQIIVSAVIYMVMNILLIGVSFALLQHSNSGELNELLRAMVAGIPLFLATLSICHCFIMNMESIVTAETCALSLVLVLPIIMNLLSKQVNFIAKLAYWHPYNLATPFLDHNSVMQLTWNMHNGMWHCYLSGIVITLVFTIMGLTFFKKKEIK